MDGVGKNVTDDSDHRTDMMTPKVPGIRCATLLRSDEQKQQIIL